MHFVYIIYSAVLDKFYVGETSNLSKRVVWHNSKEFSHSYTVIANDWVVFLSFECESIGIARKIETHIKNMKSRKYFESLKLYPEMIEKLIKKFS